MRSVIRPGVSPCDCIKYCEKWQSWDWTAPPPEPELTVLLSSSTERNEGSDSLLASLVTMCLHHKLDTSSGCWPVVSAVSVFVFWHSGCQIVSHFDEFGNNPWRADDQASLHWHHYITRHAMLRQPGTRIHFKILIIIGHLTNNDHYWISEFSNRKKVTRFKIH